MLYFTSKTRQIPVSVVTKHEESDLSLLIYADETAVW